MGSVLPGVPDAHALQYLMVGTVFLPYLISLVQQRQWSTAWRTRVSFLICTLFATGVLWNEGQLDIAHWLTTVPVLFALTSALYLRFARKRGAETLEDISTQVLRIWLTRIKAPQKGASDESDST